MIKRICFGVLVTAMCVASNAWAQEEEDDFEDEYTAKDQLVDAMIQQLQDNCTCDSENVMNQCAKKQIKKFVKAGEKFFKIFGIKPSSVKKNLNESVVEYISFCNEEEEEEIPEEDDEEFEE